MAAIDALRLLEGDYTDPSIYGYGEGGYAPVPPPEAEPKRGSAIALEHINKTPEELDAIAKSGQVPQGSGVLSNIAAGGNEWLAGLAGAPMDLSAGLVNLAGRGIDALAGSRVMGQIPRTYGGSEDVKSGLGLVGADPRNVQAVTEPEKYARVGGSDVMGMVAPYMAARSLIASGAAQAPTLTSRVINMIGGPVGAEGGGWAAPLPAQAAVDAGKVAAPTLGARAANIVAGPGAATAAGALGNAAVGAAGSLGGQGLESLLPEGSPWRPMANFTGQMVGGLVPAGAAALGKEIGNVTVDKVRELLGPMFEKYRKNQVGNELTSRSSDPNALIGTLAGHQDEIIPGSRQTTFQASGDQGIRELQAEQPPGPFNQRLAEQNQARVDAMGNVIPGGGNPQDFRNMVQQHLADLQADEAGQIGAATAKARNAVDATGRSLGEQAYGDRMRTEMEAAKTRSKQHEERLWGAIDPNKNLGIDASPVGQSAGDIVRSMAPTARPQQGEEKAVFDLARMLNSESSNYGQNMPFGDFTTLRGRLLRAVREERESSAPDNEAIRRMTQLRQSMDETIAGTAAQTQGAAAPGVPSMAQKLQDQIKAWYEARAGGQEVRTGPGGASPLGPGSAPVPFDAAAADRARVAADWTRNQSDQFKNPIIGPTLQRAQGGYATPGSELPSQLTSSPEAIQAFLTAGGNRQTIVDSVAADVRRSATDDGILNPQKFATWQKNNAETMRVLPEIGQSFGNAQTAQTALDTTAAQARQRTLDFQQGAAKNFLGAEPVQGVQALLRSKNPMNDFAAVGGMVANDPNAKAGLQRAFADHINNTFISGSDKVKADAFQTFLRRYGEPLKNIFDPQQLTAWREIAADLKATSGPYYGARVAEPEALPPHLGSSRYSIFSRIASQSLPVIAGAGAGAYFGGDLMSAAGAAGAVAGLEALMGRTALGGMRSAGVQSQHQLLTEALLNPQLARTLMMNARPANQPFFTQRFVPQMMTLGGVSAAQSPSR